MSYTQRPLEELNVIDDFLMSQLASDAKTGEAFCRLLLSTLLQRKIGKVNVIVQKTIPARSPGLRGIRLDVEVEELSDVSDREAPAVMNIYDLEPHLRRSSDLPKRNRFYQAEIDSRKLHSGEKDFSSLPNLYVLTILDWDPFGYDYMMYSIHNQCQEVSELEYEDGLHFFYFYTKGKKGGSEGISRMLRYIGDSREENAEDAATRTVHAYVTNAKIQPEVRRAYMTMEDLINYHRRDARLEAIVESIHDLLEDYGEIPAAVSERLDREENIAVLKKWLKLAAKVHSIEEFSEKMEAIL